MPATTAAPLSSRLDTTIRPLTNVGEGIGVGVAEGVGVSVGDAEGDWLCSGLLQAARTRQATMARRARLARRAFIRCPAAPDGARESIQARNSSAGRPGLWFLFFWFQNARFLNERDSSLFFALLAGEYGGRIPELLGPA